MGNKSINTLHRSLHIFIHSATIGGKLNRFDEEIESKREGIEWRSRSIVPRFFRCDALKKVIFRCPFNIHRYQSIIWLQFNTGFGKSPYFGQWLQENEKTKIDAEEEETNNRSNGRKNHHMILMPIITLFRTIFTLESCFIFSCFSAKDIISTNVRPYSGLCNGMMVNAYLYQLWQFFRSAFSTSMRSRTTNLNIFTSCRITIITKIRLHTYTHTRTQSSIQSSSKSTFDIFTRPHIRIYWVAPKPPLSSLL